MGGPFFPDTADLLRRQRLLDSISGAADNMIELNPEVAVPPTQELAPTMSAYREAVAKQPMFDEYKPSLGRNILSRIIAAGSGPEAGEEARNRPFARAYKGWEQRTGTLGRLAEMERATAKSGAEIGHLGAQSEKERELGGAARSLGRYRDYLSSGEAYAREKELTGMRNRPASHYWQAPRDPLEGGGFSEMEVMPGGEPRVLGPSTGPNIRPPAFSGTEEGMRLNNDLALGRIREQHRLKTENQGKLKGWNATQQAAADKLAVTLAIRNNPKYNTLFNEGKEDAIGRPLPNDNADQALYMQYLADIAAITTHIGDEMLPAGDNDDDDANPYTEIPAQGEQ